MSKFSKVALALIGTTSLISPAVVHAQELEAQEQGSNSALTLGQVVVQARRTDESQQEVPVAVSVLSEEQLNTETVASVDELQRLLPSLQITQGASGDKNFTIRGSFVGFSVDPAVITYLDEVPIDSRAMAYELYDLKSVQQLKGPQGTLFGRNSTGGAVLLFSNQPDLDGVGGYAQGRLGNYSERRFEGAVNVPVSDQLAVRVAGMAERRDGIIESVTVPGKDYSNRNNQAVRASLLWAPNERIENLTFANLHKVRERRYANTPVELAGPCTGPTTPSVICIYQAPFNSLFGVGDIRAYFDQQQSLPDDKVVASSDYTENVDRSALHNIFTYEGDLATFQNITYVGRTKIEFNRDFDGTPVQIIDYGNKVQTDSFYTESSFSGTNFEDALDWRMGIVYSEDDGRFYQLYDIFHFPVSATNPQVTYSTSNFKSTALYGQFTYDFSGWLDDVSLTAGYRYTWDKREAAPRIFLGTPTPICGLQLLPVPVTGPEPFPDTDLASCTRSLEADFSDSNYNVTLDWKPTDNLLLYATTRKGYKTGSFNVFQADPALAEYEPEVVKDIEFGLKADWQIGAVPVRTNMAVYNAEYTNIQSQVVLIDPNSGAVDILVLNEDVATGTRSEATIKGIEVEVSAALTSWLDMSAFYSKLDAKYDQFIISSTNTDLAGESVSGVRPTTFGVSSNITVPMRSFADEMVFSASYYRLGPSLANSNSVSFSESRESVNARLAFRNVFGRGADFAIFAKNLQDVQDCGYNPVVTGELTATCSDPMTYGAELTYRFGAGR